MSLLTRFKKLVIFNRNEVNVKCFPVYMNVKYFSDVEKDKTSTKEEYSVLADEDYEARLKEIEEQVERKRNKSRLFPHHYNILHGNVPYSEPKNEIHLSLKYKRKMFGRYGYASGVNPGALWPSEEEIKKKYEYEKVAYPYTIQEMWERSRQRRHEEEKSILERQEKIIANMKKLDQWKREVAEKMEKKLKTAAEAKAKRDALVEEVRRHFGHKIDPRDAKFQEMLLQKEKEQKKKLKEQRKKERHEKMMASFGKTEQQS